MALPYERHAPNAVTDHRNNENNKNNNENQCRFCGVYEELISTLVLQ